MATTQLPIEGVFDRESGAFVGVTDENGKEIVVPTLNESGALVGPGGVVLDVEAAQSLIEGTSPLKTLRGNGAGISLEAAGGGSLSGSTYNPIFKSNAQAPISGTPSPGTNAFINNINIGDDKLNADLCTANEAIALMVGHVYGGTGTSGGRTGIRVALNQTGATQNKALRNGAETYYKAVAFLYSTSANDGGAPGDHYGNAFGAVIGGELKSGATHWNSVVGLEVDCNARAGSSVAFKIGAQVVSEAFSTVDAEIADAGVALVNQIGASDWSRGLCFGFQTGEWPIDAAGHIIGTNPPAAGATKTYAAARGVDFSQVTFSEYAFASNGFGVRQDGKVCTTGLYVGTGTPVAANTLSSYAQSQTYTPVLSFGGNSVGITYAAQTGTFTQIGDLVFVQVRIQLSNKGTSTGTARISLPVQALNQCPLSVGQVLNIQTGVGVLQCQTNTGALTADLYKNGTNGNVNVTDADFANSTFITVSGVYKVAP